MSPILFLLWSFICLMFGLGRVLLTSIHRGYIGFPDLSSVLFVMLGAVFMDIYRLNPSKTHTFKTLLSQYFVHKLSCCIGRFMLFRFNRLCKDSKTHQENILMSILKQHKNTQAFKDFQITGIQSVTDFVQRVPLTRFENYRKYSDLVYQTGSADIMFPGHASYFAMTSGTTTGKSKLYPKSLKLYQSTILPWMTMLVLLMLRMGNNAKLKKCNEIKIHPKIVTNTNGIRCGSISAALDKRMNFIVTPYNEIHSEPEALYIHLVFGLAEYDLCYFMSFTSPTILTLFKVLEVKWESLCEDIELGRISPTLNIPEEQMILINKQLIANPKRAAYLRGEFKKGFQNIVKRIWPSCTASIVEDKYLGDMRIVSFLHIGTETIYGMNLDPMSRDVNYVALTPINFFEFIPEDDIELEDPKTFLAHQVNIGDCYEVVITTFEGLYRYRTEDVVQITGFYGTIPKYRFIRRVGDILTTDVEKVPESMLYDSVYAAIKQTNINTSDIAEFTSVENQHLEKINGTLDNCKCYVVFIEFEEGSTVPDGLSIKVDEELCKRHPVYSAMRHNQKIQPVQIKPVMHGTFVTVKKIILQSNPDASCMQYKPPRITRRDDVLTFLIEMNNKHVSTSIEKIL